MVSWSFHQLETRRSCRVAPSGYNERYLSQEDVSPAVSRSVCILARREPREGDNRRPVDSLPGFAV
jgi:hypothetical protein